MLQIFIILEYRGGTAGNNAFHYGMDSSFLSLENTYCLQKLNWNHTNDKVFAIYGIITTKL